MSNSNKSVELLDSTENNSIENNFEKKESNKLESNNKYISYEIRLLRIIILLFILIILVFSITFIYLKTQVKKINYKENAVVNYDVCLKENSFYNGSCLGENVEYISALVDGIKARFYYETEFYDDRVNKFTYYIKSIININGDGDKKLFHKEKELISKKTLESKNKSMLLIEKIEIPFDEENKYIKKYLDDFELTNDVLYKVALIIDDGNGEKEVSSISLPLNKQTFSIDKNINSIKENIIKLPVNKTVELIYIIVIIIISLFFIFYLYKLIKILKIIFKRKTKYEKKLNDILENYSQLITKGKDNSLLVQKDNIYKVETFLELLDVSDTLNKPILYYKINNIKSEFYIKDVDITYKYTLKEIEEE